MKLFNASSFLLLLEQGNSDMEQLASANTEFVKDIYELQRGEKDITLVLFQLHYLNCKLVILREHYRTLAKRTSDMLSLYYRHAVLPERSVAAFQIYP